MLRLNEQKKTEEIGEPMHKEDSTRHTRPEEDVEMQLLHLRIREDLYRAFQRCVWVIVNETGRDQTDIMNEMVHDFLVKHQC